MLISSSTLKDFGTLALFLILISDSNSLPDISIPSESNKVSACTFGFGFLTELKWV
jgi:hypothetical protein